MFLHLDLLLEYWIEHVTNLFMINSYSQLGYYTGVSGLCNWLPLRNSLPWINNFRSVCFFHFWKIYFHTQQLYCKFDIAVNVFIVFHATVTCYNTTVHKIMLVQYIPTHRCIVCGWVPVRFVCKYCVALTHIQQVSCQVWQSCKCQSANNKILNVDNCIMSH